MMFKVRSGGVGEERPRNIQGNIGHNYRVEFIHHIIQFINMHIFRY